MLSCNDLKVRVWAASSLLPKKFGVHPLVISRWSNGRLRWGERASGLRSTRPRPPIDALDLALHHVHPLKERAQGRTDVLRIDRARRHLGQHRRMHQIVGLAHQPHVHARIVGECLVERGGGAGPGVAATDDHHVRSGRGFGCERCGGRRQTQALVHQAIEETGQTAVQHVGDELRDDARRGVHVPHRSVRLEEGKQVEGQDHPRHRTQHHAAHHVLRVTAGRRAEQQGVATAQQSSRHQQAYRPAQIGQGDPAGRRGGTERHRNQLHQSNEETDQQAGDETARHQWIHVSPYLAGTPSKGAIGMRRVPARRV